MMEMMEMMENVEYPEHSTRSYMLKRCVQYVRTKAPLLAVNRYHLKVHRQENVNLHIPTTISTEHQVSLARFVMIPSRNSRCDEMKDVMFVLLVIRVLFVEGMKQLLGQSANFDGLVWIVLQYGFADVSFSCHAATIEFEASFLWLSLCLVESSY